MASIINASSTGSGGIVQTADASGVLQLQSNGTVALSISGAATTFGGNMLLEASGNPTMTVKTTGAGNNPLYRLQADTNYWDMLGVFSDSNDTLRFRYNGTDRMVMNNSGVLALSGGDSDATGVGITFPSTQVASSNANTLDDYEEGTWTPTWSGGVTGVTYGSVQAGYYRKIGSQVTIWFGVMTNGLTVTSSGLSLSGLPFTSASGSGSNGTVNVWNVTRWVSSPPVVGYVNLSSTSIIFYNSINATGAGVDPVEVTTGNMSTGSGNRNLVFGSATYSV